MHELTRLWLVDVLILSNENERLFSSYRGGGERKSLFEGSESKEVI